MIHLDAVIILISWIYSCIPSRCIASRHSYIIHYDCSVQQLLL